ncbi:MAG: rubredoxin-type Fe(Cys)4 protein, partial [Deltaproteobacteria bacterium]|nr:rubredoxin-type Fe(Cys)4 protein [Deltaproteobacteria bacterium]
LGSAAAIATGLFTWWVNYGAVLTTYVKYKIALSIVLWVVLSILVIWRFLDPMLIIQSGNLWWLYVIIIFSLVPLVSLLGHFGGKMVFPG